jgi:hypothetical protein
MERDSRSVANKDPARPAEEPGRAEAHSPEVEQEERNCRAETVSAFIHACNPLRFRTFRQGSRAGEIGSIAGNA